MTEKLRCAAQVSSGPRTFYWHQCKHAGTLEHGGKMYCKMHHPPTQKEKRDARWLPKIAAEEARWKREELKHKSAGMWCQAMEALKACAAVCAGEVTNKKELAEALEKARAVLEFDKEQMK